MSFHQERDYGQIAPILTDFPLNQGETEFPTILAPPYSWISRRVGILQLALSSIIVYLTEEKHSVEVYEFFCNSSVLPEHIPSTVGYGNGRHVYNIQNLREINNGEWKTSFWRFQSYWILILVIENSEQLKLSKPHFLQLRFYVKSSLASLSFRLF